MKTIWHDMRFGLRQLLNSPGFAVVAVVSLVLGVTLNSAIFSLVDGLCLRSMPFTDPDRVVQIFGSTPQYKYDDLSYADYRDLREQVGSISDLATYARHGALLENEENMEDLRADVVSRNFFKVLGIQPYLGRFFSEADDPDLRNTLSVVLSHRLWRHRFGSDPNLVGQSIVLTGRPRVVLAVAPPGFNGFVRTNPAHVWFPARYSEADTSRDDRYLSLIGRLKPGVSVKQAQTEVETIFRRLDLRDAASHKPLRALVMREVDYQRQQRGILGVLLLGAVGTILLLACANVSSLLLARAEVRAREMAVRAALGANRWRLIRQLLAECLILASITTVISLPLAYWIIRAWPALLPPMGRQIALLTRLDGRVFIFTAAISLLSILLFGLAPALHATGPDLLTAIKGEAVWGKPGRKRYRGLGFLVAGQTSIALVLVIMATLLMRSLLACYDADLGFERKELLLVTLSTGNEEQGRQFHQELKERVQALPGVKQVCLSRVVPFSPSGLGATRKIFLPNTSAASSQDGWSIMFNAVDPGYFELLGIPVLRGRTFNEQDNKSSAQVMVINETMAHKFWPNEDPVGQWVRLRKPDGKLVRIVGVVRDTNLYSIKEASKSYLFLPLAQHYWWESTLLVESATSAASLAGPVRSALVALGRKPTQSDISTMEGYIRTRLTGEEFLANITVLFGLLGLGLAAVGLYGVLAYMVNQHTHEIGIRMALGAKRNEILCSFLRRGMTLVALGAAFGIPVALALGYALHGLLYGVKPLDPLSVALSLVVLLIVALLASSIPARRASRIDPMEALRYE